MSLLALEGAHWVPRVLAVQVGRVAAGNAPSELAGWRSLLVDKAELGLLTLLLFFSIVILRCLLFLFAVEARHSGQSDAVKLLLHGGRLLLDGGLVGTLLAKLRHLRLIVSLHLVLLGCVQAHIVNNEGQSGVRILLVG